MRQATSSTARLAAWLVLPVLAIALTACGSDGGVTASDSTGASATAAPTTGAPASSPGDTAGASPGTGSSPSLPSVTDATEPTEPVVLPECSTIWVVGQQLPRNYQGCTDGGTQVAADGRYCEIGKPLFTFGTRFYAVENGPINRTGSVLAKDPVYQKALRSCGG